MIKYKLICTACQWEPFVDKSTTLVCEGRQPSIAAAIYWMDGYVSNLVNELPADIKEQVSCLDLGIEYQLIISTEAVPEWHDIRSIWAFAVLEGVSQR